MAFRKQFLTQRAEARVGDPFVIPSLPSSSSSSSPSSSSSSSSTPPFEANTSLMLSSEAMTIGGREEDELELDLDNVLIDTPSSTLDFFKPVSWNSYFDSQDFVTLPNSNTFRIFETKVVSGEGPTIVMLHGAGHSALSWALTAHELKKHYRVMALDLRGHGETRTENDTNLSASVLCQDVIDVLETKYGGKEDTKIVLVGHSMGGALAAKIAARDFQKEGKSVKLQAVVVIDVVEGTAQEAIQTGVMHKIISARPKSFGSLETAIEWCLRSRMLRNAESARVSVPSLLVPTIVPSPSPSSSFTTTSSSSYPFSSELANSGQRWKWRTDLLGTEPFWIGWFEDLSTQFLSSKYPRLLILAGTDRLDKTLTIAQMQGKFQLAILPQAGHVIHEDAPHQVAAELSQFIERTKPLDLAALLKKARATPQ